jgi:hypothetical protein
MKIETQAIFIYQMMMIWDREKALSVLLEINGGYKAGTCRNDDLWYLKRDLLSLRQFIFDYTLYLDKFFPSFHLRLLCLKIGLTQPPICLYCDDLCAPVFFESTFRKTCKRKECISRKKSETTKSVHKSFSKQQREEMSKKIGLSNSISYEKRHGKEKADLLKEKISAFSKKRKQSIEEKQKRVQTRKENNKNLSRCWHSDETKKLISDSNKLSRQDANYKVIHKENVENGRKKQSETMKKKILNGSFTPNSDNWKRSISFHINLNDKKLRFRSRWEAIFYLVKLYEGDELLYETVRIPYSYENNQLVYIIDFLSSNQIDVFEVRPKSRQTIDKEIYKFAAAKKWCEACNKNFHIIDEDWFILNKEKIEKILKDNPNIQEKLKFRCPT